MWVTGWLMTILSCLELFDQGTAQHVDLLLSEAPIQGVCLYSTVSFFKVLKHFEHSFGRAMMSPIFLYSLTRSYARWRWESCQIAVHEKAGAQCKIFGYNLRWNTY